METIFGRFSREDSFANFPRQQGLYCIFDFVMIGEPLLLVEWMRETKWVWAMEKRERNLLRAGVLGA
jgi:hypothetical protein